MHCKDCKFWDKSEPGYIYGDCHRRAPGTDLSVTARPSGTYERVEVTITSTHRPRWPNTHQDDWCGEFEPKSN
jgi:hypothetical protein